MTATLVHGQYDGVNGTPASVTFTRSYTPVVGDLEIVAAVAGENTSSTAGSLTGPSGWTQLFSTSCQMYSTTPTRWARTGAWYRFYQDGDGDPSISSTQDGGAPGLGGALTSYRGLDSLVTTEVSIFPNYNNGVTSETLTPTTPSCGAGQTALLVMSTSGIFPSGPSWTTPPTGWEDGYAVSTPYDAPGAVWFSHRNGDASVSGFTNNNGWWVICLAVVQGAVGWIAGRTATGVIATGWT